MNISITEYKLFQFNTNTPLISDIINLFDDNDSIFNSLLFSNSSKTLVSTDSPS